MTYEIKTYQEGFIDDQFRIGSKIYDPWPMGGQTRPDQLKQAYTADDFDPSTRFYAFNDDKMVGFLTASFKEEKNGQQHYFFEFPYVEPEHAPEAERELLDHAIDALKNKGADVLRARAGEYWGKSKTYAEEYGFERKQDIARRAEIDLREVDTEQYDQPSSVVEFDYNSHVDDVAKLYADRLNTGIDTVKTQLKRWEKLQPGDTFKSPWDQKLTLIGHYVAVEDDEVVGRIVCMNVETFGNKTANINQLVIKPGWEEKVKRLLIDQIIQSAKKAGKEALILHTGLWGLAPSDEFFSEFDLEFTTKLSFYEKTL